MFNNVMPQRAAYFQLLSSHADRVVGGANATLRLVSGLGNHDEAHGAALIDEVNLDETSADAIKAEYIKLLYESFTTPLNRDQMHTLVLDMDRVLDGLQSVANAVAMYNIPTSTPAARILASLCADACLRLQRAVAALADRHGTATAVAQCREVDGFETRARAEMHQAVKKLFTEEGDEAAAWHALKMRRFYSTQLGVLDSCRRAAKTIEEIVIENT